MQDIKLIDVLPIEPDLMTLFKLLLERTPKQSISHRVMPCYHDHCFFVRSLPYQEWYFIYAKYVIVGAVYLTKNREIGIGIFNEYQGNGYGVAGVTALMEKHPGEFFANVAPSNDVSANLFRELGFKLVQHTYRLDVT